MPAIRRFFHSYFAIIDRYLLREFTLNLFAVLSVLWLIFVATRFARYLSQAAVGNLPADVIFILLGYSSLGALSLLLPMAAFLAVMLALGRMSSDSELTVIAACGIPQSRVIRNVLIFAGTIGLTVGILSIAVMPDMLSGRYDLEQRAKMAADTGGLIAGSFKEARNGEWTFYSQELSEDKRSLINVFIEIHRGKRPVVFRAERGRFDIDADTGNKYLVLENGSRYEGQAGDQDFTITEYEQHSLLIEKGGKKEVRQRHRALSSTVLWQRGNLEDKAELQWRVSGAIMTVILCLIAIRLANAGPRKGRYAGFFPAILVYIIYSNFLGMTKAWVANGVIPAWFGAIWVHLLMIIVLVVIVNQHKFRHRRKKAKLAAAEL